MDYVVAAANLRAFNYDRRGSTDRQYIAEVLKKVKVAAFTPSTSMKIATTDSEAKQMDAKMGDLDEHEKVIDTTIKALPTATSLAGFRLRSCEFEKDVDTNFHMDFITAASNLRARNYKIKEVTKHQTKFVAGKIIPAIATTTALVTGLVCLELYKLAQNRPMAAYRNSYTNLALPLFTNSEPMVPDMVTAKLKSGDWKWSLWDRIEMSGDVTLAEFIDVMKNKYGLSVSMLSYAESLLFNSFLPGGSKKKGKDKMTMRMSELVEAITKVPIPEKETVFILEACVQNEQDEDVEIPCIRLKFR